jgi:DNA-binding MarR family transcriptional regulator
MISSEPNPTGDSSTAQRLYHMIHEVYVYSDASDRQVLTSFDLSISQFRVLTSLRYDTAHRLTTLSERLLLSKSTITRVVDELEQRSWLRRVPDPDDRRAQRVGLTPEGAKQVTLVSDAHERYLEQRLELLRSNERQQLNSLLEKLSAGLRLTLEADGRNIASGTQPVL